MNIQCQCDFCLHKMAVPPKMAGKKILCPLCGDPLSISQAGTEITLKPFSLREGISKFQFTDWDRAFSKVVLDEQSVPTKEFYVAICGYMKAKRKTDDISLSAHLEKEGILDAEQCHAEGGEQPHREHRPAEMGD